MVKEIIEWMMQRNPIIQCVPSSQPPLQDNFQTQPQQQMYYLLSIIPKRYIDVTILNLYQHQPQLSTNQPSNEIKKIIANS